MYDVIIIGAGPAGITASLYTKRSNLKTLILYQNESSLEKTEKIENYYGFEKAIKGTELYKAGINQAINLGVEVLKKEVIKIENENEIFKIYTDSGQYICKSLILATGNKKNKPKIKGIDEFEGKGISYCAICDGFFYKNKDVCILGNGNYAISEVNELINVAKNINILTNGEEKPNFRGENIKINDKKIKEIKGTNKIEEIEFEDGSKIKTDALFIAQGVAGSSEFARKLGIIQKQEKIIVDENMKTNIKGIYACGDCIGGILQISKAVYEGMIAGLEVTKYIKEN